MYLCSDKCYNIGFMTTTANCSQGVFCLLVWFFVWLVFVLVSLFDCFHSLTKKASLSTPLFLKEKQFNYSPTLKEHPQGREKLHLWLSPDMSLFCFRGYMRLFFDILLKLHEFLSDVR